MVNSCMLVGDCIVWFLKRTSYCTLDRRRFGLRMIGMLLALSASCVFPLRLHASLPRNYNWLFSLMSASCPGLRPPAAMTDGWFPPCKLFPQLIFVTLSWSTTTALSFFELAEEDCFGHANVFHPCDVASLALLHLKQDGLYAGQDRLALLRTSSFDTWSCHLMPRVERKQRWWNRSSSLICFR